MKKEQVIELAKKAGASFFPGIGFDVISLDVPKLVALVEQATLERAAHAVDGCKGPMQPSYFEINEYMDEGIAAIRNLAKEIT